MNFIGRVFLPQRVRRHGLALALAGSAACGGHHAVTGAASSNPEAAVRAFLNAVKANDLAAMRELWGSDRGPAGSYMDAQVSEQRLTVIKTFLEHESFTFDQPNLVDPGNSAQRIVRVRLVRKGCQPVVPFTAVLWKDRWLVKDISLADAGNPARPCQPGEPKPGT